MEIQKGLEQQDQDQRAQEIDRVNQKQIYSSVGAICELRNMDNFLVFVGRIQEFDGKAITVSVSNGKSPPPVLYNTPFKVIIHAPGRQPSSWMGSICGSSEDYWWLNELVPYQLDEQRANFRQSIKLPAMVHRLREHTGPDKVRPCLLRDISLGGANFHSREYYEEGEALLLSEVQLRPDAPTLSFRCQVMHRKNVGGNTFSYGCRFELVCAQDEDQLCGSILYLQRRELQERSREEDV